MATFVALTLFACGGPKLTEEQVQYVQEFEAYLTDIHSEALGRNKSYIILGIDCFSCSEDFIMSFAQEAYNPSMVPVICGRPGSVNIEESLSRILNKYPNSLIDYENKMGRYKISESGKSVLMRTKGSQVVDYWDLGQISFDPSNPYKVEEFLAVK